MSNLADMDTLFMAAVAIVAAGFMLHAAYTVINLLRLRNLRMSWGCGLIGGFPVIFWVFLTLMVSGGLLVWSAAGEYPQLLAGLFGWIGLHGAVASGLAGRVYITDHGVVHGLNRPCGTIAWYQVTDYACREEKGRLVTLLFFQEFRSTREGVQPCSRKTLIVPAGKRREFEKVVSLKLGKTIDKTVLPAGDLRLVK